MKNASGISETASLISISMSILSILITLFYSRVFDWIADYRENKAYKKFIKEMNSRSTYQVDSEYRRGGSPNRDYDFSGGSGYDFGNDFSGGGSDYSW